MIWALITRLPDILAVIGFLVVLWGAVKATLKISSLLRR